MNKSLSIRSICVLLLSSTWLIAGDPVIDERKAQIVETLNNGGFSPIAYIGLPAKTHSGWAAACDTARAPLLWTTLICINREWMRSQFDAVRGFPCL